VDISVTVCLFLYGYGFAPPRIKLAESHFELRFIGVPGRESHIFGEICSPRSPISDESASACTEL